MDYKRKGDKHFFPFRCFKLNELCLLCLTSKYVLYTSKPKNMKKKLLLSVSALLLLFLGYIIAVQTTTI